MKRLQCMNLERGNQKIKMIRKNFFNRLKYLISATLILCLFPIEDMMAKDPPPGSGSGDVPVNVLFLLDNSLSMRRQIIPGDGMWSPWSLVETDNGDIIISQMARRGLTKITVSYTHLTLPTIYSV